MSKSTSVNSSLIITEKMNEENFYQNEELSGSMRIKDCLTYLQRFVNCQMKKNFQKSMDCVSQIGNSYNYIVEKGNSTNLLPIRQLKIDNIAFECSDDKSSSKKYKEHRLSKSGCFCNLF